MKFIDLFSGIGGLGATPLVIDQISRMSSFGVLEVLMDEITINDDLSFSEIIEMKGITQGLSAADCSCILLALKCDATLITENSLLTRAAKSLKVKTDTISAIASLASNKDSPLSPNEVLSPYNSSTIPYRSEHGAICLT